VTEEVNFRLPRGADFRCDYSSRLCAMRGGLKMQKNEKHFPESFAAGAGLRMRPLKST
jgi:hypothetical protein